MHRELLSTFQYLERDYREVREGHFVRNCGDRTRENGHKLKEGKLNLDIRKKLFIVRMIRY